MKRKTVKRKWHYAGPLRNWPAGSWGGNAASASVYLGDTFGGGVVSMARSCKDALALVHSKKWTLAEFAAWLDAVIANDLKHIVGEKIERFWDRFDDNGVKHTIKIDECDRKRVSRELAEHLANV